MLFPAQHGFRVVAHDRRGHGRSSQSSEKNDMDGYADDLAALFEALNLTDVTLVGHSTGAAKSPGTLAATEPGGLPARSSLPLWLLSWHGEDDQIVPMKDSAKKSARLIKGAKEIYYPGEPHGLTATLQDKVNADLLQFLQHEQEVLQKAA